MRRKNSIFLAFLALLTIILFNNYLPDVYAEESGLQERDVIIVYKNDKGKDIVIEGSKEVNYEFKTVPAIAVSATEDELVRLKSNSNIDYIEENIPFSMIETGQVEIFNATTSETTEATQWNILATNILESWKQGYTGNGVKVAVLDTGISTHDELTIAGGVSTVDYTDSWEDDNGHGTHVSGIIAAQPEITTVNGIDVVGLAPNVDLYAVKILDNTGSGNLQDILEGLDWAIANEMDILNLSIGSIGYSKLLEQMINDAYDKGIILVAASGNDGLENSVHYPAKFTNVIAASSVSELLNISDFSSTGNEVDFSAPGENIISTFTKGIYASQSGTSQATPHVTGMLALLKEKYPHSTNSELKVLLSLNAKDLGVPGQDPYYGYGFVYYHPISETIVNPSISYSTHVQSYGWMDFVADGEVSGTTGESKRLEAIKIELKNTSYSGDIVYSTHVQDYGWTNDVVNGEVSGTVGQSKRMEAIKLKLTEEMAEHFDVYYRVHSQNFGWLDWAKNGQPAGTEGLSKRLEAVQIVLVDKGGQPPGSTDRHFLSSPSVVYSAHVQSYGWLNSVADGEKGGTTGQSKRVEAILITLKGAPYDGGISYSTHVQDYGWLSSVSNGEISGTTGESKRVEAIKINLTGAIANHYDVYYRMHVQSFGWLDWAKNGKVAGTQGLSKRAEAVEILLVKKGGQPPG
ncbi:S8 family serine peptidase [Aquibacillus halophilus]|uniref:S8 family serine peptidase n=1 Tax=Aquibacillus halophilus TaxID=930132 RepID=A0A6A8DBR1_9BACI|nr:S8 family serine peptidase [Aquibacillus halophilus]MRH41201.1 S8 family serine peptidase [Aquibacillus halophilus]